MLICVIATALAIHKGYITNYGVACLYLLRKIEYFMVGFMGYYFYKSEKDNDTINKLLNASIVIFTIISILQLTGKIGGFALGEYSQNVSDRVIATFSGAYEYSAFLSIVFFKFLYDINYKRHKIFDFFMLVIIMFNIIITKSRISLIAVIAIFIYFFIKSKVSFLKKFLVLDLAIIFSVLFLQLAPNLLDSKSMERFRTINLKDMYTSYKFTMQRGNLQRFLVAGYATYNSSTDLSFDIRVSKWADMFDGFKQNPFWGIGVSTTGEAIDGNYIRYLAESGILGFMAWLLFILTVTKQIINIRRNWLQSMLFYGLMALFINAIFIDIFEASKVMMTYWFLVGILFKSDKLENSIDNVKHKNKKIQIVWGDKKLMG
jgi:O-antigen ligase